jgi:hypothetical protein
MRLLKWLGILLALVVLAVIGTFIGARWLDGPLGPIPGGPLVAGPLFTDPVGDWGFVAEIKEIELQLTSDSTSRTVWMVVHEGMAFVPCSLSFPPGKSWHRRADTNGDAMLRILGRRYPVQLSRVEDPEQVQRVVSVLTEKYAAEITPDMRASLGGDTPDASEALWLFEVRPREVQPSADPVAG